MAQENNNTSYILEKLAESLANLSLAFFIIVTGLILLNQIPELWYELRFLYTVSIMGSSVYFIMELYLIWRRG